MTPVHNVQDQPAFSGFAPFDKAGWETLMRRGRKLNSQPRRAPTPAPWYRKHDKR